MKKMTIARIAAGMLLLSVTNAFAATVSCPDPIGSYNYQAYLGSAFECKFQDGNTTAADINTWWPNGWTEQDERTAAGSGTYLSVTVSPSWGQPPMDGTWQISQSFWNTFGEAVISFHIGNGNASPDSWAFRITPNSLSGTWGILDPAGITGNGMSNMKLFGRGQPSSSSSSSTSSAGGEGSSSSGHQVPESSSTLVLLGLGILGIGFMRRRKQAA